MSMDCLGICWAKVSGERLLELPSLAVFKRHMDVALGQGLGLNTVVLG